MNIFFSKNVTFSSFKSCQMKCIFHLCIPEGIFLSVLLNCFLSVEYYYTQEHAHFFSFVISIIQNPRTRKKTVTTMKF